MIARGVAVLGLLALVCAGCATGTVATGTYGSGGEGGVSTSPMMSESKHCEGWYDTRVNACDSMGD